MNEKALKKIRLIRLSKEISQDFIAEELGVSQSHYSKMEKGERNINLSQLEKIAKVLNVSIQELFN
jgi:transcriptional regulator with XRE-family HTH domain